MTALSSRTRAALCCIALVCSGVVADAAATRPSAAKARAAQSRSVTPDAVRTVEIDVQSAEANRTIDLSSLGQVYVAILGSTGFDATTVDPASVTMSGASVTMLAPGSGKPGTAAGVDDLGGDGASARAAVYDAKVRDVNGDGRADLLLGFPIQHLTDLTEGLERVELRGRTTTGVNIAASQTIVARGSRGACCDNGAGTAPAATTCNSSAITINDATTATPYPSNITVSGETGVISSMTVSLTGVTHTFIGDVQILLVGPTGQKVVLMAMAPGLATALSNVNLTFDDASANNVPNTGAIASGSYKPTVQTALTNFAAPAPAASVASPFAYTLNAFRGTNPNGTWSLYVRDLASPDSGSISGGWCVNITTAPSAPACMTLNSGTIAAGDPTQTGRLVRNGVFSMCSALKPAPGTQDVVVGRRFDTYTITNQNTTTQCVSASLSNGCGANQIYLAAYSNSYNPASILTNFLADNGSSMGNATVFGIGPVAFTMAPGATVVLVVHEITTGSGCASYGLLVEGNICPPPCVVTCPSNVTTSNTSGQCGAVVNYPAPTTTGSCGTVTCSPASGSFFPVGTTTVTCTPTTGSPCMFTVTVNDTQAPTITCPGNQGAVETPPGSGSATVNYPAPTASDNCPGVGAPTCSPASGSSFPLGTTTVNCSVTDASSNSASCSFTVTVTAGCAITCPANVTVSNAPNQCSAVVNYPAPTTSGPCGTVTCTPASGSSFPVGTTTVTCSETSGAMCTFTVTVNDTQPPAITCAANVTANNTPGMCSAVVTYGAITASDNCTPPMILCSQASGSSFPVGTTTVTCTATDAAANSSMCSFTVTVNDTQPPSITCPANVSATANTTMNGTPGANVMYTAPTTSDNCTGMIGVTCTPASGSFFPQGTTTVTCTATDPGGNTATCSFTVSVSVPFDVCFHDEANGNTLSFVTNPASPLYRLWQFRIASSGQILQGYAESLSYNPFRSLVAYDRDSATVRMDANASFTSFTCTATILNRTTGVSYAFRDRDTRNNPACGAPPPPPPAD